eukprot:1194944-Prorocentrum_minimum.AAC.1
MVRSTVSASNPGVLRERGEGGAVGRVHRGPRLGWQHRDAARAPDERAVPSAPPFPGVPRHPAHGPRVDHGGDPYRDRLAHRAGTPLLRCAVIQINE